MDRSLTELIDEEIDRLELVSHDLRLLAERSKPLGNLEGPSREFEGVVDYVTVTERTISMQLSLEAKARTRHRDFIISVMRAFGIREAEKRLLYWEKALRYSITVPSGSAFIRIEFNSVLPSTCRIKTVKTLIPAQFVDAREVEEVTIDCSPGEDDISDLFPNVNRKEVIE